MQINSNLTNTPFQLGKPADGTIKGRRNTPTQGAADAQQPTMTRAEMKTTENTSQAEPNPRKRKAEKSVNGIVGGPKRLHVEPDPWELLKQTTWGVERGKLYGKWYYRVCVIRSVSNLGRGDGYVASIHPDATVC